MWKQCSRIAGYTVTGKVALECFWLTFRSTIESIRICYMIFANAFAIGCLGVSLESPWLLPRPWPCGCVTSPALGESAASAHLGLESSGMFVL
jgi:hypothetical protein